jgi:RimJ/RimL family protein N-acetyltransferase
MVAVDTRLPERTERLTLRALVAADLANHHRLFSNPDVVRYLYDAPLDLNAAEAHLSRRLRSGPPGEGEWRNLAVECGGRFIGEVGVTLASRAHRQCEIGYVFDPAWHGHGYATEASAAMVDYAFEGLGAHRVVGRMDARNDASARVLERLGMRREAHLRQNEYVKGEWTDEVVYAVLEDAWPARRQGAGVPR